MLEGPSATMYSIWDLILLCCVTWTFWSVSDVDMKQNTAPSK